MHVLEAHQHQLFTKLLWIKARNQTPSPLLGLMALQWCRENLEWFWGSLWRAERSRAVPSLLFFQAAHAWFLNLYWDWCCQVWAYISFYPQVHPPDTFIFASFPLLLGVREDITLPSSVCWDLIGVTKNPNQQSRTSCVQGFSLCVFNGCHDETPSNVLQWISTLQTWNKLVLGKELYHRSNINFVVLP